MTAAVFIIMGIITARLLEKRRMRIAAVAHAVFFILFGFFILLIPEKGGFAVLAERLLGEKAYATLRAVMTENSGVTVSIAALIEIFVLAGNIAVLTGAAVSIEERASKEPRGEPLTGMPVRPVGAETDSDRRPRWLVFCRLIN